MSENHSSNAASTTVKTFFGGIVGVWGVVIGLLITCVACVALFSYFSSQGQKMMDEQENTSPTNPGSSPTNQAEQTLDVEINSFIKEFDDNQLAAESRYKGKSVRFTGYVDNISEDILGDPFVSVKPTNEQYYFKTSIQCYFDSKDLLLNAKNGQQASFQGKVDTQSLGIIVVKNCQLL